MCTVLNFKINILPIWFYQCGHTLSTLGSNLKQFTNVIFFTHKKLNHNITITPTNKLGITYSHLLSSLFNEASLLSSDKGVQSQCQWLLCTDLFVVANIKYTSPLHNLKGSEIVKFLQWMLGTFWEFHNFLKCLRQPWLGWAEARSPELLLDLP